MLDAKSLLGGLMQAGLTRSSSGRLQHAVGRDGQSGMLGSVLKEVRNGNPMALGGLGALAGAVIGGGKGSALRGAVGGGALALLGSLAFDALRKASQRGSVTVASEAGAAMPPTAPRTALPPELVEPDGAAGEAVLQSRAVVLLRAMISAAKADGQIDGREMERIMARLDELGADQEARDFVLAELRRPLDLEGLAGEVDAPDLAAEVYAASLLAIEVDTEAERSYLRRLAARLGLAPEVVQQLHRQLDAPAA
jgi:uncharacterized membrane protein YebE (DUF533 family)